MPFQNTIPDVMIAITISTGDNGRGLIVCDIVLYDVVVSGLIVCDVYDAVINNSVMNA